MCFRALAAGHCKIYSDLRVFTGIYVYIRRIHGYLLGNTINLAFFSTICARIPDEFGPKTGEIGAIFDAIS